MSNPHDTAGERLWAQIPASWKPLLEPDVRHAAWLEPLATFVEAERAAAEAGGPAIFPPAAQTFTALTLTPPSAVKAVILGQDPYFRPGQANGLAFSVAKGVRVPPSLRNVFAEMSADLGSPKPTSGDLTAWAERGVLLLNTILTVRSGTPASHARKGWEKLSGEVLRALSIAHATPGCVFILWGSAAQSRRKLIEAPREGLTTHHAILEASHPSPRSVDKPAPIAFQGSRPFSRANAALRERGVPELHWPLA